MVAVKMLLESLWDYTLSSDYTDGRACVVHCFWTGDIEPDSYGFCQSGIQYQRSGGL